MVENQGLISL